MGGLVVVNSAVNYGENMINNDMEYTGCDRTIAHGVNFRQSFRTQQSFNDGMSEPEQRVGGGGRFNHLSFLHTRGGQPQCHVGHHFVGHHGLEEVLVVHAVEDAGPKVFPIRRPG